MDLAFSFDDSGRLICDLTDGRALTTATAADASSAILDFVRAIDSLRENVVAECFWEEERGTYRWMFCRRGESVDVVVMWCAGVITGWRHVFRAACELEVLQRAQNALQRIGVGA